MSDMANYGTVIHRYHGTGNLHISENEHRTCKFAVLQNTSGTIYAECELEENDAEVLELKTASQLTGIVEYDKSLTLTALTKIGSHLFIGKELSIESDKYNRSDKVDFRFALTNLLFLGTESYELESDGSKFFDSQLTLEIGNHEITIRRVENYRTIEKELRITQRPAVTCHAIVMNIPPEQEPNVIEAIGALCLLLTLARGCRVDWPYYDVLLPSGETVRSYYRDAIIKPYSAFPLIAKKPAEDIKGFVEDSYPILQEKKEIWELQKAVDVYTDAKLETDFLESRGLKTVVAMEHLKSRYLLHDATARATVIDPKLFKKAKKQFLDAFEILLKSIFPDSEAPQIEGMINYAQGINRVSFGDNLSELCNTLGLQINDEHRRFVGIRNRLIHSLSFLNEPDRNGSEWDQYMFLMTYVGKVLLAILEYEGHYNDWTNFSGNNGYSEMRVKLDLNRGD